jgi:methylphosphotriester-DNA--protein-cysteine methyltransferase
MTAGYNRIPSSRAGPVRVQTAIQKIETHTPNVPSVAFLKRNSSMNIKAFIRLFREQRSLTSAMYARERRIKAARLLLPMAIEPLKKSPPPAAFRKQVQR